MGKATEVQRERVAERPHSKPANQRTWVLLYQCIFNHTTLLHQQIYKSIICSFKLQLRGPSWAFPLTVTLASTTVAHPLSTTRPIASWIKQSHVYTQLPVQLLSALKMGKWAQSRVTKLIQCIFRYSEGKACGEQVEKNAKILHI